MEKTVSIISLSFCGNDCKYCPRYIATKSGNKEQLKNVAVMWHKYGWRDTIVSPEEIACNGCYSAKLCRYDIQKCAKERKVANCGVCRDYPCSKVKAAFAKTELYAKKCKKICSAKEYEILHKAFFLKKENLDKVNKS